MKPRPSKDEDIATLKEIEKLLPAGSQYAAQEIFKALQNPFAVFIMLVVFRVRKFLGFIKRKEKNAKEPREIAVAI
jgi:hypothetical protein